MSCICNHDCKRLILVPNLNIITRLTVGYSNTMELSQSTMSTPIGIHEKCYPLCNKLLKLILKQFIKLKQQNITTVTMFRNVKRGCRVREFIRHIGLIPRAIPRKLFLDIVLLRIMLPRALCGNKLYMGN